MSKLSGKMQQYYAGRVTAGGPGRMEPNDAIANYQSFETSEISVASVADFCDSMDRLRGFSTLAGDLKDVQRPWMIKALLGSIQPGGRILEIGAGEPFVADFLARCGYDVTIVDPYDGSGHGPTDFEVFQKRYPALKFVRRNFGDDIEDMETHSFDGIYSISVLEHVPDELVASVCSGVQKFCRSGGVTIHAIDHVLRGKGDLYHLDKLLAYAGRLGFDPARLVRVIQESEMSPETYFLSAEGHNRWRGSIPYDEFPMRKVISVQLVKTFE
jgi:SAM-dependent methyltransferase